MTSIASPSIIRSATALAGLLLLASAAQAQTTYATTRTSSFTYYQPSDGVVNGLLKSETIEPGNAQQCVATSYTYDANGNKNGATTANCTGASGQAVFTTRTSGSAFGAVATQPITVNGSVVNVAVPGGIFPSSNTNALNQSESRSTDPRFGAALTLTGPNALTTSWVLDDFGRIVREQRADNTSSVSAYCVIGAGLDNSANSSTASGSPLNCTTLIASLGSGEAPTDAVMFVHSESHNSADAKMGPFVRVYSDRLGRQIRSVTESFDGSAQASGYSAALIVKDSVYNQYGAKVLETQPYFLGTGSSTIANASPVGLTRSDVDVLGRVVAIYTADAHGSQAGFVFCDASKGISCSYPSARAAQQLVSYAGLNTTTTNDKTQTRLEEKNANGELVRVTDANGAQLAHQRDAFGNLIATRDALQNTVTISYDTRGRKTQMVDPDTGTWNYIYDALGQLVWQQSPNQLAQGLSVATTMVYDLLGRMTSRAEPEYTSTWSYDKNIDGSLCMQGSAPNRGAGKLCESSTSTLVDRKLVYDNLGRPINSRTTVSAGPSFASALAYEVGTGRVLSQTYPTGVQVGYSYTARGFLEKLLLNTAATVAPLPSTPGGTPGAGTTLSAGSVLWQAQVVNAWGRAEQQFYGNGVTGNALFEAASGRVTSLTAGASGTVLSQQYSWDSLSNLTGRTDNNGDTSSGISTGAVTETFTYADNLNRLTQYSVSAPAIAGLSRTVNLQYNALGMLLYKSDVGNYSYSAQGGVRPHALVSVAGALNASYTYDANGNLKTASAGKYASIAYTSFNLPDNQQGIQGPGGTPKYTWQYDESHARIQEVRTITGGTMAGTRTLWYLHPDNQGGLGFESEVNSPTTPSASNPAVTSNRHFLSAGGQVIGVLVSTGALPTLAANQTAPTVLGSITLVKVEYWHKDHLGSLITTTDHAGNVTQRYAYDPFGKRRYANGSYDEFGNVVMDWSPAVNWGTDRGFTGHEQLDDVGLVNMNGRIFDPTLGVFLQGDPFIQDPANLQSYNRYGYCFNNPLTCTDPSGYFFGIDDALFIFAAVVSAIVAHDVPELRPFIGIAWSIALVPGVGPFESAIANSATAGFISGAISSGGTFRGGVQGAFSAGMFAGAGNVIAGGNFFTGGGTAETAWKNPGSGVALHSVVGCVSSVAGGNKCGPGALSAAFSKGVAQTNYMQRLTAAGQSDLGARVEGTIISAVVGGTASALGGGKFANGAQTGAFSYLYNELLHVGNRDEAMHRAGYEPTNYWEDGVRCNGAGDASCRDPHSTYGSNTIDSIQGSRLNNQNLARNEATGAAVGGLTTFAVVATLVAVNMAGFPEVEISEAFVMAVAGEPVLTPALIGIMGSGYGVVLGGLAGFTFTKPIQLQRITIVPSQQHNAWWRN